MTNAFPRFEQFKAWLRTAPRGARHCYYFGDLARDRGGLALASGDAFTAETTQNRTTNNEAEALATLAWTAYRNGKILLSQLRVGAGQWAYFATKRLKPREDMNDNPEVQAHRRAGR